MKVKLVELYNTIQGEGAWMGQPVTLIRLGGCDNKCKFCDTKQSWNKYNEIDYYDLVSEINKLVDENNKILITGGEPLYRDNYKVVKRLTDDFIFNKIAIETSGKHIKLGLKSKLSLITISPKKHIFNIDEMNKWEYGYNAHINYKFVIGQNSWAFDDVISIINEMNINKNRVWLMPETKNGNFNNELSQNIWNFCIQHKINYSDRLHCRVFGNKQGI